jgi:hypothetical protein
LVEKEVLNRSLIEEWRKDDGRWIEERVLWGRRRVAVGREEDRLGYTGERA